jgi:hypothetical protein
MRCLRALKSRWTSSCGESLGLSGKTLINRSGAAPSDDTNLARVSFEVMPAARPRSA